MCCSRANAFTIRIPGDALLRLGGELGDPLLDLLHRRAGEAVEAGRREDHERHRQQRQRRQPGLDREHHRARQQQRERVLGQEDQPVAEEEADRLEVDRRPRHQLPGLLRVEEPQLERLEVGVDPLPQVELDRHRDLAGDQPPDHGQPQPQDAGADDRHRQRQRCRGAAGRRSRRRRCRPATGSAPSSPSPARRRPAIRPPRGGRGEGNRAAARRWSRPLTIQSEVGSRRRRAGPTKGRSQRSARSRAPRSSADWMGETRCAGSRPCAGRSAACGVQNAALPCPRC